MQWIWLVMIIHSIALGHANLKSSTPAQDTRVYTAPTQVILNMVEPVEMRVSTFKVYALNAAPDKLSNFKYLNTQARTLFNRALKLKGDEAQRSDSGVQTKTRTAQTVMLGLKPALKLGAYSVMWQVLSVDGHRTAGWIVFVYQP